MDTLRKIFYIFELFVSLYFFYLLIKFILRCTFTPRMIWVKADGQNQVRYGHGALLGPQKLDRLYQDGTSYGPQTSYQGTDPSSQSYCRHMPKQSNLRTFNETYGTQDGFSEGIGGTSVPAQKPEGFRQGVDGTYGPQTSDRFYQGTDGTTKPYGQRSEGLYQGMDLTSPSYGAQKPEQSNLGISPSAAQKSDGTSVPYSGRKSEGFNQVIDSPSGPYGALKSEGVYQDGTLAPYGVQQDGFSRRPSQVKPAPSERSGDKRSMQASSKPDMTTTKSEHILPKDVDQVKIQIIATTKSGVKTKEIDLTDAVKKMESDKPRDSRRNIFDSRSSLKTESRSMMPTGKLASKLSVTEDEIKEMSQFIHGIESRIDSSVVGARDVSQMPDSKRASKIKGESQIFGPVYNIKEIKQGKGEGQRMKGDEMTRPSQIDRGLKDPTKVGGDEMRLEGQKINVDEMKPESHRMKGDEIKRLSQIDPLGLKDPTKVGGNEMRLGSQKMKGDEMRPESQKMKGDDVKRLSQFDRVGMKDPTKELENAGSKMSLKSLEASKDPSKRRESLFKGFDDSVMKEDETKNIKGISQSQVPDRKVTSKLSVTGQRNEMKSPSKTKGLESSKISITEYKPRASQSKNEGLNSASQKRLSTMQPPKMSAKGEDKSHRASHIKIEGIDPNLQKPKGDLQNRRSASQNASRRPSKLSVKSGVKKSGSRRSSKVSIQKVDREKFHRLSHKKQDEKEAKENELLTATPRAQSGGSKGSRQSSSKSSLKGDDEGFKRKDLDYYHRLSHKKLDGDQNADEIKPEDSDAKDTEEPDVAEAPKSNTKADKIGSELRDVAEVQKSNLKADKIGSELRKEVAQSQSKVKPIGSEATVKVYKDIPQTENLERNNSKTMMKTDVKYNKWGEEIKEPKGQMSDVPQRKRMSDESHRSTRKGYLTDTDSKIDIKNKDDERSVFSKLSLQCEDETKKDNVSTKQRSGSKQEHLQTIVEEVEVKRASISRNVKEERRTHVKDISHRASHSRLDQSNEMKKNISKLSVKGDSRKSVTEAKKISPNRSVKSVQDTGRKNSIIASQPALESRTSKLSVKKDLSDKGLKSGSKPASRSPTKDAKKKTAENRPKEKRPSKNVATKVSKSSNLDTRKK